MIDLIDDNSKEKVLSIWHNMQDSDKEHFINQVALALSIWGSDEKGKTMVLKVLNQLVEEGSSNLADFGLFIEDLVSKEKSLKGKIKRAALIIEGYRIKHALPSEPHKPIV